MNKDQEEQQEQKQQLCTGNEEGVSLNANLQESEAGLAGYPSTIVRVDDGTCVSGLTDALQHRYALYPHVQLDEEETPDLSFKNTRPTPDQHQDQHQEQDAKQILIQRETANLAASFTGQPAHQIPEPTSNNRSTYLHRPQPNVVPRPPQEQEQLSELDSKQSLIKQETANLEIAVVGHTTLSKYQDLKNNYVKTGPDMNLRVAAVGIPAVPPKLPHEKEDVWTAMARWASEIVPLPGGRTIRANTHQALSLPGAYPVSTPLSQGTPSEDLLPDPEDAATSQQTVPDPPCLEATLSPPPAASCALHHPSIDPIVEATAVDDPSPVMPWYGFCSIIAALIVILGLSIGLAGQDFPDLAPVPLLTNTTNSSTTHHEALATYRLDQIKERGYLRCSYTAFMMLIDPDTGDVGGFNSQWCLAIAAAIWGPKNASQRVHYVLDSYYNPENSTFVDMTPVVHGVSLEWHALWTKPIFYDARRIAGERFFVEHCAEQHNFKHIDECEDLKICAFTKNQDLGSILEKIPPRKIVFFEEPMALVLAFVHGECNLFFNSKAGLPEQAMKDYFHYEGNFTNSETVYGVTPFFAATTITANVAQDALWTDFVNAVLQALIVAEQHNITQSTWHRFPKTQVFGPQYQDMFRHAIQVVGNYGEIYQRYLPPEDRLMNNLNNGTTGLIQSPDVSAVVTTNTANMEQGSEGHPLGENMQKILDRRLLYCGVQWDRPGFATRQGDSSAKGMDVEYCRTLAAALFNGDDGLVEFVDAGENGYVKLVSGEIDVLAGATWSLESAVWEPVTKMGFAFSTPYFYKPSEEELLLPTLKGDNLCLATMQDDKDWASFVYYVVSATIYAEQQNITAMEANQMPLVQHYGPDLKRMLRDAIYRSGNYATIFSRNLDFARTGRNLLDDNLGPQLYPMPGFF